MTDQSRVDAVARALYKQHQVKEPPGNWEDAHALHQEWVRAQAQAAIEGNDAWLKGNGWKPMPLIPSILMRIGMLIVKDDLESLHLKWPHAWHIAPKPEEPDQ